MSGRTRAIALDGRNLAVRQSEASFQAQVVELAEWLGWRVMHVRATVGRGGKHTTATSVAGWPDLFLWHEAQARTMAAELKSDAGRATPEQVQVLDSLRAAGVEVRLWRPRDWDEITSVLGRQGTDHR